DSQAGDAGGDHTDPPAGGRPHGLPGYPGADLEVHAGLAAARLSGDGSRLPHEAHGPSGLCDWNRDYVDDETRAAAEHVACVARRGRSHHGVLSTTGGQGPMTASDSCGPASRAPAVPRVS